MTPDQDAICRAFAVPPRMIGLRESLPRKARLRLWLAKRIDHAAIWLVNHHQDRTAVILWRVCRLW